MGDFVRFLRQGFVVVGTGGFRVKRQVELVLPAELEAGARQRIVAHLRCRMSLGKISRMGGNLVGMTPTFTSSRSGRPRCSFGVT